MAERMRYAIAVLLLFVGVAIMAEAVYAQDVPAPASAPVVDRSSPRKTVFGFLGAVNDVLKERVADVDDAKLRATNYLQLAPSLVGDDARRTAAGWPIAMQVRAAVDYHKRLEPADVPDVALIGGASYWSIETAHGPLTLVRTDEGWLFSAETLYRVGDVVLAFERSGADKADVRTIGDRVRERFPTLHGRALFLRHWQWLGLVSLLLLAWLSYKIVAFLVAGVIGGFFARRGGRGASTAAARAAGRPVGFFGVAALVALLGPLLELPVTPVDLHKWFVELGAKLFASLGAVLVLYRLADVIAARLGSVAEATESRLDDQLVPLIRKSMKILVTVGGVLFILDNLEADIWSLLAGASVAGVAVAFAAKDTIANLFGSVTVFLDRPFQVGDWVVVDGVEGTVEEVGFRSTRVRTFYNSLVSVPNSKLVDGIVDNMGMRRYRRFKTVVGVRYDTPPERLEAFCHGMREIVLANEFMRHDYFEIYLNDWGASSLNVLVYVFFDVPDWDAELRERQNFMLEVIRLAGALDIGFAFPTRTLEVEATPERPAVPPSARPVGELSEIARSFGKGGSRSTPGGTDRFSSRARAGGTEESRGDE